jgi:hypothetical protein
VRDKDGGLGFTALVKLQIKKRIKIDESLSIINPLPPVAP